jgi:hypothetical protein
VRKGWAAVILQKTKQRIGIDLIARADQIPAAIIAAEVVSKRRDGAAFIEDVFARCAGIQDCVGDVNRSHVINAPARRCRVAGDRAICNTQRRTTSVDTPPVPAELPLMVLFTITRAPETQIPPPLPAVELPLMVLLATVKKV